MASPLLEVTQKPAVNIAVAGAVDAAMVQILEYGLEEEGIPFERQDPADPENVLASASQAAKASRINVGVCIQLKNGAVTVVLQHRDLPENNPLFTLEHTDITADALDRIGRNAARLVKGDPFLMAGSE